LKPSSYTSMFNSLKIKICVRLNPLRNGYDSY
jgi:hypothetical protein